jgi:hypothetical protein
MPPFSDPFPADWMLPIIKLPLLLISGAFWFIRVIGPIGDILLVLIVLALFARNLMRPPYVDRA